MKNSVGKGGKEIKHMGDGMVKGTFRIVGDAEDGKKRCVGRPGRMRRRGRGACFSFWILNGHHHKRSKKTISAA